MGYQRRRARRKCALPVYSLAEDTEQVVHRHSEVGELVGRRSQPIRAIRVARGDSDREVVEPSR